MLLECERVEKPAQSYVAGRAEKVETGAAVTGRKRSGDRHIWRNAGRMTKREMYEQKTEAILQPIVDANGFELVDVEYVKEGGSWYLRAYIDKPGGITVDDCELVSRAANDILDEQDFVEESYIFEVSSPGLGRPLKKEKDFVRSIGEEVEIRTFRAIEKQKEFYGILKAFDKESVTIVLEDESEMQIARADIALIRLAFDF
ncbi:ribosome maturation factor RimP family protein [Marvinbryantia formatexigens DSM 14469]|uniref:Ribosome maturation factor RimP n=2 Tax=Marvinbryantia TaxID=248744 RepID=C6LLB2_9FIRM|nr:ribosome maturation factor RimP family protein [Marvinbryantia formatexigens DSM 14469]